MKKLILVFACLVVLIASQANAWMIVDPNTYEVVDQSDPVAAEPSSTIFLIPAGFEMRFWDSWWIVLTSLEEEEILWSWIGQITFGLDYIPVRRDCDDFAIIAKGVMAYHGYGNSVGLVIDYTIKHAYICYWRKLDDGTVVLRKFDPLSPFFATAFPTDHEGHIYW